MRIGIFPIFSIYRFFQLPFNWLFRQEESFVFFDILGFFVTQDLILGLLTLGLLYFKSNLVKNTVIVNNEEEKDILEIGSAEATLRLLKDLRNIKKKEPKDMVAIF